MKLLRLAKDLALPVDAATQTFLNVGKRGSGKSTTAARLVEQLLAAKVPVAVLDPVDTWYGLKAARDGKSPGHDIYVFGGRHADLPLEPGGGALIADVLCEYRVPMVLSCKHLSGRARGQFMADFATTLFQKWQGGVLHLVLEEAHEFAPQQPQAGEEQMLGTFKRLWKLARSSGIGGTAITQRPASLHKDITTQAEILVVHRTIGPQDVAAVREWIRYHHGGEEILGQLAHLSTGEAFVWAPEFPEDKPIGLKRVRMLPRDTFDSSATPKYGEQRAEPKALAHADIERLRTKMAATIERAKAEDPKELQRQVAELKRELAKKDAMLAEVDVRTKNIDATLDRVKTQKPREVPVLKEAQVARLETAVAHAMGAADRVVEGARKEYQRALDAQTGALKKGEEILAALRAARREGEPPAETNARSAKARAGGVPQGQIASVVGTGRPAASSRPAPAVPRAPRESAGNGHDHAAEALTGPQQKVLDAAAFLESIGIARPDVVQLALFSGRMARGGNWRSLIGRLRTLGLIEGVSLTDAGRTAARDAGIQSVEQLHQAVMRLLTGPQAAALAELIKVYPDGLEPEDLGSRLGREASGGNWRSLLGRLRSLGLVSKRGPLQALPVLFLEQGA